MKTLKFLAFLVIFGGNVWGASEMVINEIATNESAGTSDWVEIFVATGGNYSNFRFFEGSTARVTFPAAFNPVSGDFIVINFATGGTNEDDASGKGANGYWDFFTTYSGIVNTDGVLAIKKPSGDDSWMDGLAYSNRDGNSAATFEGNYNTMLSSSAWTGPIADGVTNSGDSALIQGNCANNSGIVKGKSIGRSTGTADTNSFSDWVFMTAQTKGSANLGGAAPPPPPTPPATVVIKITEVAPSISGGDFIEFFVQTGGSLTDFKAFEGTTELKKFPALTPKAGKHIVLHVASSSTPDETDSTGDTNGNGYIDLFSTDSGLTGTDNAITLKDTDDQIVDFLSYADNSTTYTGSKPDYDAAVAAGQWIPGATSDAGYISGSVAWSGLSTQSMSRVPDSSGNPTDNNRKDDWTLGNQSPGDGFGTVPQKTASTLEVFQSPFSPFGDGRFNKALIAYNVPENSLITIRVFDLQGRQVRTLLDAVSGGGASASTFWDGKDDFGNVLPVGIYLVNVEAQDKSSGDLKKSSKSVVLGRKLK